MQVLVDLFRHPDKSMQELAELLETTLEQMNQSATLMADGVDETRRQLATLSTMADRHEAVTAELLAEVRAMRAEQAADRSDLKAMRTELRHLRRDSGLEPIPTSDNA